MTRALTCLTFALLFCASASAQTTPGGRYEKDGLSFSYPDGWVVEDKSNSFVQHLILTREGGSSLVVVTAHRELITQTEQLAGARRNVWKPYAEDMALRLGIEKKPPWEEMQCEKVGERAAPGVRLSGKINGQPTTGEVYALMLGRRFVTLLFVRHDKDEALEVPAWKSLLGSLKIEEPPNLPPLVLGDEEMMSFGMFGGKAIYKPQPPYPSEARTRRAQGQVRVQVVVDEKGNVISAKAISGHSLLHRACELTAMLAKFSPTIICGRPVKVKGVITYNFVLS